MAFRPIRTFPDPVLSTPARRVGAVDAPVRSLLRDMVETMYAADGVGLAAPQVGVPLQAIVVDPSGGKDPQAVLMLVNPVLVSGEGEESCQEGCLSLPDLQVDVTRFTRVTVEALDQDGAPRRIEAEGLLARALQHEIDHLQGKLIIGYLTGLRREMARKKFGRNSATQPA
jgi:peptide deformylase